jgi:hypothetical protein
VAARSTIADAPASSATPRTISIRVVASGPVPNARSNSAPRKAEGTEPTASQPTSRRLTVRRRRWTAAPTGRITTAATRSLEMAAVGVMPNMKISIGVISAPPPAPVSPTSSPTMALPSTM